MTPPLERQTPKGQGWQREQRDDITLSEACHVLWERRALVAGCTLVFVMAAFVYGLLREPAYVAEVVVSVRPEEGIGAAESLGEILSGFGGPAAEDGFLDDAAERAGWEGELGDFRERIGEERSNSGSIAVSFSSRTPDGAARGANAYADTFVERIRGLDGRLAGGAVAANAAVEKAAVPPESHSGFGALLVALVAGGVGLLVGGIAALFVEGRARRWSGSKDAELTLRAPVLGVIPDYSDGLPGRVREDPPARVPSRDGGEG